jgi:hypothetical protein
MVWNKTWNFSAFESVLRQVNNASNGNVIPFAALREPAFAPHFIKSNGGIVTQVLPDGSKQFVAHENERTLEAMTFLGGLIESNLLQVDIEDTINLLARGDTMFLSGTYENLRRLTRQDPATEFAFGLLPIPMGDHMDDFIMSTHNSEQFYIVQYAPNPHEIAAILVAMANRISKINVMETELNYGVQDMESAQVLEMMLEPHRWVMDYSRLSSARNNVTNAINMVLRLEAAPRQAFEQFAGVIQANYDSLAAQQ